MLRLYFFLALLCVTIGAYPNTYDPHHHQRQYSSPCNDLANAQAAFFTDHPDFTVFAIVPANLMYNCLTSVPVQKNFSLRLVNNARAWFEFQSDVDYVASPPSGSLWKPLDLFAFLDDIADYLLHDRYKSQYDFELDLFTFAHYFHDGHTAILPGLFNIAQFYRNLTLISYSTNGTELPKVYLFEDVLLQTASGFELAAEAANASPVETINDIPVQEFLQTQALVAFSHDPDTMYNELFSSIALTLNPLGPSSNYFSSPLLYPGPETIVKREDGTVLNRPTTSGLTCDLRQITSGEDFWRKCVFEEEDQTPASTAEGIATSTATATVNKYVRAQSTAEVDAVETGATVQLENHPVPERIAPGNVLSGYFLEDHEDVAVLVVRGFDGPAPGYMESFQNTLELFLEDAREQHKTKLILDFQGNGGGYIDLSTELMAQLFPNVPPNEKTNMRASLGMQLVLERLGRWLDLDNEKVANADDRLENESATFIWTWQAVMSPDAKEFLSFEDFYGPNDLGKNGNYTRFFQGNYTNRDPSELDQERIQITGYGDRQRALESPPPFNASNIVILTDGTCASACTIVAEMLLNAHSVPSIVVGGRPSVGPMQTMGGTKGSLAVDLDTLKGVFLYTWLNETFEPSDLTRIASTPFQHLEAFGLMHGVVGLNGRNSYRIGDDTETPLQMVYSAADCKIWPTLEMLIDQSQVWSRVADIAFDSTRKEFGAGGGPYTSEFCVKGSTGHSTSVTGGLKYGQLGNQNPPRSAYSQYSGWLKDGKEIVQGLSLVRIDDDDLGGNTAAAGSSPSSDGQVKVGLPEMKTACDGYSGNKWMITLLCRIFG